MNDKFLELPIYLSQNLDVAWTLILLMSRFTGLISVLPGIGGGKAGLRVRAPAVTVFALASLHASPKAAVPADMALLIASLGVEFLFGLAIGLVPLLVVVGVQTGIQLATTTMGLGAAALLDPTSGGSVSDLARIQGDLAILLFLLTGTHYFMIEAAAGMAGNITPGLLSFDGFTAEWIMNRVGAIFYTGIMVSSPVVIALLLTQFVMGLISKAVPSVNIFIISFPLTIGIGMILTILALPNLMYYLDGEFGRMEFRISELVTAVTPIQ